MRETSCLALSISPTSPLLADASRAVVAGLNPSAGTSCRCKVAANIGSGYMNMKRYLLVCFAATVSQTLQRGYLYEQFVVLADLSRMSLLLEPGIYQS